MVKWLRENTVAAFILTVLRLWLGWQFLEAGYGKLTGPKPFDAAGFLHGAAANPVKGPQGDVLYGWWVSFLNHVAIPHVGAFNFVVPWGETLIGLGLILGCLSTAAVFFALVMNFSFFLSGTVSHNPYDILVGFILLFAGFNASRLTGLDHWVIPAFRKLVCKKKEEPTETAAE